MKALEAFIDSTKKLAEAATPGEWTPGTQMPFVEIAIDDPKDRVAVGPWATPDQAEKDALFIAASRTRLPLALELLSEAIAGLKDSCVCDPGEVCPACDALKSLEAKAKESHE